MQKHIVVVLGMHRSGTSVITKALETLGVNLGQNLLPAKKDNNKGFFEDKDIYELNVTLLKALGHDWHTLSPVQPNELLNSSVSCFLDQAMDILRSKLVHTNLYCMKDPRIPRLLPFWLRVFSQLDARVSYVIACRNPLSVARSLKKRDGFDLEKGYILWLEHTLRSLTGTAGMTRVVVDYDCLMDKPVRELQRMANVLELEFDADAHSVKKFQGKFLESSLCHTRYQQIDLGKDVLVPDDVKELHGILSKLADNSLSFDVPQVIDRLREIEERFQKNQSLLSYLRVCDDRNLEMIELEKSVAKQKAQIEELEKVVVERDSKILNLESVQEHLDVLLNSRSWRYSEVLRRLGRGARKIPYAKDVFFLMKKVRPAIKPGRGLVLLKTAARRSAFRVTAFLDSHPVLRQRVLNTFDGIGVLDLMRQLHLRLVPSQHGIANPAIRRVINSYSSWSECFDTPGEEVLDRLAASAPHGSSVLLLVVFTKESAQYAGETALSLKRSVGQDWQAVFFADASSMSKAALSVIEHVAMGEPGIFFNELPADTEAEFVVVLQGGALPRRHSFRVFADVLRGCPEACFAYSDEDLIDEQGQVNSPWFKPRFSSLLHEQGVLLGQMVAVRTRAGENASLIRSLYARKHELMSAVNQMVTEANPGQVLHIPHVLYHARVYPEPLPRTESPLPEDLPVVSIIIPTRDMWSVLEPCLVSLKKTEWPKDRLEVIIVDNGSTEKVTIAGLDKAIASGDIRVVRDDCVFNWSRLNNVGVCSSNGEFLVFLNNDTEVYDGLWLQKMLAQLLCPGTGAVGCKLLYPDHTVQHGGVVAGIQGVAGHAHLFLKQDEGGYRGLANLTHEVVAVTGACLAVSRKNYDAADGFNEDFRVAFNDTVFCFELTAQGKRNVYVADPLFIHHESKSRGYDDTSEKVALLQSEARQAWSRFPELLRSDPFYSPNLSLWRPYQLTFAPRFKPCWEDDFSRAVRVMLLSVTHAVGHGVPVVLALQAEALLEHGYEVVVGGPLSDRDFPYPGCQRVEVHDSVEAAYMARKLSVDVVIAHTPPFFAVSRWTGDHPRVIDWDHGEPPADFFPDAAARKAVLAEKFLNLAMATRVVAISKSVEQECKVAVHQVIRNGNSHLGAWGEAEKRRRDHVRKKKGWDDAFVVLNVCRFHAAERKYKGVDMYADVREHFVNMYPDVKDRVVFVLAGKGNEDDVAHMSALGVVVAANITDEEMIDLYCAADVYANFSQWEGYNLGIGQALAMGLPVVASDIPAHREFGVTVVGAVAQAAKEISDIYYSESIREPRVWKWDDPLEMLCDIVESVYKGNK